MISAQEAATFDAQTDIAALVYGAGEDPDSVIIEFSQWLVRQGRRPFGLAQRRLPSCSSDGRRADLIALPEEKIIEIGDLGPAPKLCPTKLALISEVHHWLDEGIEAQPDLLVINRFGALERDGGGLCDLMVKALERDIPVLIAVPEGFFERWVAYSAGMAVRLPCNGKAIRHWWSNSIACARNAPASETYCGAAK